MYSAITTLTPLQAWYVTYCKLEPFILKFINSTGPSLVLIAKTFISVVTLEIVAPVFVQTLVVPPKECYVESWVEVVR